MRRSILLTVAVLGAVLSLVGMTGVFAPFTDSAQVGSVTPNRIGSAARPLEADLKVATFAPRTGCGTFADDLPDPLVEVSDLVVDQVEIRTVCVRNDGGQPLVTRASLVEVVGREIACTGSEAEVDTTCQPGETGELGNLLFSTVGEAVGTDCGDALINNSDLGFLDGRVNSALLGTLDPGETGCIGFSFRNTGGVDEVLAQSDEVTFKIQFDGTTA